MLQPPNPVAGATAERSPVVADDPDDVIPRRTASRDLGRDRRGLEDPPVDGSLADEVAPIRVMLPQTLASPGKPLARRFWAFWGPFDGIRGPGIACNARNQPPEG